MTVSKIMRPKPHSRAWYERLARMQGGYYYPWRSRIAPFNGEDAFWELLRSHLSPDLDVLEAGCGHGEVALEIAGDCRSVLAYDRVAPYISLAREAARRRGVGNVEFVCADSSAVANGGRTTVPAGPDSFDLLVSRCGPLHWVEDACRVARAGAVLIHLNPDATPPPVWNEELPEGLRLEEAEESRRPMREAAESVLASAGLTLHSCWGYDVPEAFADPEQFYLRLTWGCAPAEVPGLREIRKVLESIFERYAGPDGLELRHRRFIWKSVVTRGR